jgi:urease accessory protein
MHRDDAAYLRSWRAELELGFERRGTRTALAARRHDGPLVVQKPFYPEGEEVCHAIVVHPPGGIAGGDELEVSANVGAGGRALLTTPGAGKWYRSAGPWARQRLVFEARDGACLEWLPQESIVFDGALAELTTDIRLHGDARYFGWEVLCFGRTGSGERFARGECRLRTELRRDGRLLWLEQARIEAGGLRMTSDAGLAGRPVCGTFAVSAPEITDEAIVACRERAPASGEAAVTRLAGVLLARYRGDSSESARRYFAEIWSLLRPLLAGRGAVEPRIWRT